MNTCRNCGTTGEILPNRGWSSGLCSECRRIKQSEMQTKGKVRRRPGDGVSRKDIVKDKIPTLTTHAEKVVSVAKLVDKTMVAYHVSRVHTGTLKGDLRDALEQLAKSLDAVKQAAISATQEINS